MAIAREKRTCRGLTSGVGCLLLISMSQQGYADNFPFSSTVENTAANINISFLINCSRADGVSARCATGGSAAAYTDPTPFLQEVVFVDGIRYYHVIVGDAAQDFVQEVYINATACCYQQRDSWPKSASDGYGSGNPGAVVFRMMMSDEDFEQHIIKDTLATKPAITQLTNDAQSSGAIELDMSGIDYSTANVSGIFTNTFAVSDQGQFNAGNFDMGMISDGHVTAG
ncbi:MAG TPA: hypothetical protein VIH66_06350, partial [Gammaproteobacteria bacterium]